MSVVVCSWKWTRHQFLDSKSSIAIGGYFSRWADRPWSLRQVLLGESVHDEDVGGDGEVTLKTQQEDYEI